MIFEISLSAVYFVYQVMQARNIILPQDYIVHVMLFVVLVVDSEDASTRVFQMKWFERNIAFV